MEPTSNPPPVVPPVVPRVVPPAVSRPVVVASNKNKRKKATAPKKVVPKKGPKPKPLTGKIRNELKAVLAVYQYNTVFTKTGLNLKSQECLMYDLFHGCQVKSYASHVGMLSQAKGKYLFCNVQLVNYLMFAYYLSIIWSSSFIVTLLLRKLLTIICLRVFLMVLLQMILLFLDLIIDTPSLL
jgi:hypothetical protein